jgi:hypothetical protein
MEILKFDRFVIEIDPEKLRFDETSLSHYIQTESGYYDNFGGYLAKAERNQQNKELLYEQVFHQRYIEAKEEGGTDKLAEARAKADQTVNALKNEIIEAKYVVNRLKQHLKAWDKSHDNAQSLGHMMRKQIDKLNSDIKLASIGSDDPRIANMLASWGEDAWNPPVKEKEEEEEPGFDANFDVEDLI